MPIGRKTTHARVWGTGVQRAYVIGASQYLLPITPLRTPRSDAAAISRLLKDAHGYTVRQLGGGRVGLEDVMALLASAQAEVRADDRVLFYFAGHGVAPDSDAARAGYLLPESAVRNDPSTFLSMDTLYEHFAALPCRHLLVILDCCFAGSFRWARARSERQLHSIPETRIYLERVHQFLGRRAWQLVTSASSTELAADILFGQRQDDRDHSPFAAALLDGLKGDADLRVDRGEVVRDGVITLRKLVDFLSHRMMQVSARQTVGYYPLEEHADGEYLFLAPGVDPQSLELPSILPRLKALNPYLGLDPYDFSGERARPLYGRDGARAEIRQWVTSRSFTVVAGASGAGKSSLVRAGLMVDLATDPQWTVIPPIRPGTSPIANLFEAAGQILGAAFESMAEGSGAPVHSRAEHAASTSESTGKQVLLCVDQFEDLVTQSVGVEEATRFCALLWNAKSLPNVHLVLVIRSDHERRFRPGREAMSAFSVFQDAWADARYAIPAMDDENLRAVIRGPANEQAVSVAQGVVDTLVREAGGQPWRLPLLAATLEQLYNSCVERLAAAPPAEWQISSADYRRVGGVESAVIARLKDLHEEIANQGKDVEPVLRRILMRMVNQDGRVLSKRQVARSEFLCSAQTEAGRAENARVEHVLQALVKARLVVTDHPLARAGDDLGTVELIHDSVLHQWQVLVDWIEKAQQSVSLTLRRRLTQDAMQWLSRGAIESTGPTWASHPELPLVWKEMQREPLAFNQIETEFIRASQSQAQVARRRTGLRAALVVLMVLLLSIGVALALEQLRLRATDLLSQRLASQAEMIGAVKPDTAVLLSVHALNQSPTNEAQAAILREVIREPRLVSFLAGQTGHVEHLAFSPNGKVVAAASSSSDVQAGRLTVWNVQTTQVLLTDSFHAQVMNLALSPNGDFVAMSFANGDILLSKVSTGVRRKWRAFPEGVDFSGGLRFSPDGRCLSAHSGALLWNLEVIDDKEASRALNGHSDSASVLLELGSDCSTVYSGGADGRVLRHDLHSGRASTVSGPDAAVALLALNPKTGRLAIARQDGRITIQDLASKRLTLIRKGDGKSIRKLKFNEDGTYLAAASDRPDGSGEGLTVWSTHPGAQVALATPRVLHDFSLSNGGALVAVAGIDSYLHIRAATDATPLGDPLVGHAQSVYAVSFSPVDPGVMASSGDDGVVILWDLNRKSRLSEPLGGGPLLPAAVEGLAFSESGRALVGGGQDGMLFFRTKGEDRMALWKSPDAAHVFSRFAFSEDGNVAVAGGETDGLAIIAPLAIGPPRFVNAKEGTRALAVSEDGTVAHRLDTGGQVHAVRLADGAALSSAPIVPDISPGDSVPIVAAVGPKRRELSIGYKNGDVFVGPVQGGRFRRLLQHVKQVTALAYALDGAALVSAGMNTVRVTEIETGRPLATLLENHRSAVVSLAVSGQLLAIGCVDGTIVLFSLETLQQLGTLSGHADAVFALAFQPVSDHLASGGRDKRALLWRLDRETLVAKARQIAGRNLSAAEWQQYVGADVPYQRTFADLPDSEGLLSSQGGQNAGVARRVVILASLAAWIPLMLACPWWRLAGLRRSGGLSVLYALAIVGLLVGALQPTLLIHRVPTLAIDLGIRVLGLIAIALAAAWMQRFLELHPPWMLPLKRALPEPSRPREQQPVLTGKSS